MVLPNYDNNLNFSHINNALQKPDYKFEDCFLNQPINTHMIYKSLPHLLIAVFIVGFMSHPTTAQVNTDVDTSAIDDLFSQWDEEGSPGCAVGIYHEDEIIYENGYGEANLDYGIPNKPGTVFYIGSVSKHFAAAAIAILADKEKIDLDEDINEYIEEMPEYDETIRIKDLVYHTSGIYDLYSLLSLAGINVENVLSLQDKVDLISSQSTLNFEPGSDYMYSNSGYTLMNKVIKEASGKTLPEFTDAYIFEPLGMEDTHFHDDRTKIVPRRALSYQPDGDGFSLSYINNFEGVGPGGLYTTIEDMLKWDSNFYDNQIEESPNFYDIMHTPGVLSDGDTLDYAFALNLDEHKGQKRYGHGGSFMGFRADYRRFPEHHFSTAVFCNLGNINPGNITEQIADIYLVEAFEEYLEEFAGTYHNSDMEVDYEVKVKEGNLYLDRDASPSGEMSYSDTDEYNIGGWSFEFTRDDNGEIDGFKASSARAQDLIFERR